MTPYEDQLDSTTHARIFEEKVVHGSGLNEALSHVRPKAIVLGGQPGAGKGGLTKAAELELQGDVVKIDPDELRNYHPLVNAFRAENPYTWSGHTHADASQWADELREAAVAGRKNFILDTTLSNGPWSAELVRDLQAKGYEVEVRVVASPKLESELGVDQRFSEKVDTEGYGRHVPEGAREAIYDKVPTSLDTIRTETTAPIRIFNREGQELYDSRTSARSPGQVLIEAREARLHDPEVIRDLKRGWHGQHQWHEDLPDAITRNPKVAPGIAQRLLAERNESKVAESVQRYAVEADRVASLDYTTRAHLNVLKGLGVVGGAAVAYDAATTVSHTVDLLHQSNTTGAASTVEHFGARNLGMLGGAALSAELFGAAGIESGPLDLIVAGAGGVVGAVAGDKLANAWDDHKIYSQTDPQGQAWHLDPKQPQAGWTRTVTDAFAERGLSHTHVETAPPALAERLTFQANNTAVELALARPATPRDARTRPRRIVQHDCRLATLAA